MNKDYTWGDILIATCRKMFLNKDAITVSDLPDLVDDRNYATYINMAPDVMNELMVILNNRVMFSMHELTLRLDSAEFEDYIKDEIDHYEFYIQSVTQEYRNNSY